MYNVYNVCPNLYVITTTSHVHYGIPFLYNNIFVCYKFHKSILYVKIRRLNVCNMHITRYAVTVSFSV